MIETMQKHHQTFPINSKSITSLTLYNISFQIKNTNNFNALNKNNFKKP